MLQFFYHLGDWNILPMNYTDSIELRYPKGSFAMTTVYMLSGASILASTIFSLLLFLSIDDNIWMKVLFGSLAVIFEIGKFYAWYEYGERRAHRNMTGAFSSLLFYFVLAAISIGGSIGGINSATNQAQGHIAIAQAKINAYNRQIDAIDKQIALNDEAAQKYIEINRITFGVAHIQAENKKLREEQQTLAMERDSLPPVSQGSIVGLIESLAKGFGVDAKEAQFVLVLFLSVLLDFFAAFFVGVIGEELRYRHFYQHHKSVSIDAITQPMTSLSKPLLSLHEFVAVDNPLTETIIDENIEEDIEPSIEQQIINALDSHQINCSKKAVVREFQLSMEDVDNIFISLLEQGMVGKKANNHFYWVGKSRSAA